MFLFSIIAEWKKQTAGGETKQRMSSKSRQNSKVKQACILREIKKQQWKQHTLGQRCVIKAEGNIVTLTFDSNRER